MDNLEHERQLIRQILNEYAGHRYLNSTITNVTVFDEKADRYLVIMMGREN